MQSLLSGYSSILQHSSPQKYMQVGPKTGEDVPPGVKLCHHTHTGGKCMPTGSGEGGSIGKQIMCTSYIESLKQTHVGHVEKNKHNNKLHYKKGFR